MLQTRQRWIVALIVLGFCGNAFAAPAVTPKPAAGKMTSYDSPYYTVFTDLPLEDAKETIIRMTKMAEEYHERTKTLFSGTINQKLPFYLYASGDDYYAAGGMAGSAGVFMGTKLMAMSLRNRAGGVGTGTWHVVQHEGFHQFVHYVVRGDIPVWVNEGMAEYFGEGLWTGDGMQTGLLPNGRLKRVREKITSGKFKTAHAMMMLTHAQWNASLDITNYDQAWSMVHFLAHAENGKYQDAFANFMQDIGRGRPWEKAWEKAFGSAAGFEEKWKEYWEKLPDNPTADQYARATVATLTSFVGRAYTQKQGFDNFDEFVKTEPSALKIGPADWLPTTLYTEMLQLTKTLQKEGYTYSLERGPTKLPQVVCLTPAGIKMVGSFTLRNGGLQVGKVNIDTPKPVPSKPAVTEGTKK